MVRRISCRVVRSVPLSGRGDFSQRVRDGAGRHFKSRDVEAANVRFESPGNPATYSFRCGTAGISVDDSPIGRIVDFYA